MTRQERPETPRTRPETPRTRPETPRTRPETPRTRPETPRTRPETQLHHIWFLVWPGVQALDLVGPHEVFNSANRVADGLGRGGFRYRQHIVANGVAEVASESGLRIGCEMISASLPRPDTLILPGGDGVHDAAADADVVATTRTVGLAAERLATVCTGTFLAAEAGLLAGKRVATHWARAERLTERFPNMEVDAESLFIRDENTWSSAGVTAGIDLALALVEHDHDAEVAQIVARWLVLHLRRPGGQSQFAAPVWSRPSPVEPIRRSQESIHADPGAEHNVAALASAVGLSPRHFTRLFTAEVGESPGRFVDRVRVEAARRELETGADGMTAVAKRCGFGTAETMRRAFKRRLGVSPDDYRRRFQLS